MLFSLLFGLTLIGQIALHLLKHILKWLCVVLTLEQPWRKIVIFWVTASPWASSVIWEGGKFCTSLFNAECASQWATLPHVHGRWTPDSASPWCIQPLSSHLCEGKWAAQLLCKWLLYNMPTYYFTQPFQLCHNQALKVQTCKIKTSENRVDNANEITIASPEENNRNSIDFSGAGTGYICLFSASLVCI